MNRLTATLLRELIDHIDVYHIEGRGKNRTRRIKIHYRFIGYIEIPQATFERNYIAGVRQGVEIEYIPNNTSAKQKKSRPEACSHKNNHQMKIECSYRTTQIRYEHSKWSERQESNILSVV